MNGYRLIYPYNSENVYVEIDVMKAADKCYDEIKNRKVAMFSIMNIDTNNVYNFEIPKNKDNKKNEHDTSVVSGIFESSYKGGSNDTSNVQILPGSTPQLHEDMDNFNVNEKIKTLESQIKLLQTDMATLKNTLNIQEVVPKNITSDNKKAINNLMAAQSNVYSELLTQAHERKNNEDNCTIM